MGSKMLGFHQFVHPSAPQATRNVGLTCCSVAAATSVLPGLGDRAPLGHACLRFLVSLLKERRAMPRTASTSRAFARLWEARLNSPPARWLQLCSEEVS